MFHYMNSNYDGNNPPQIAVGDFNIYPTAIEPAMFLTGKLTYQNETGNLFDVWEYVHGIPTYLSLHPPPPTTTTHSRHA